MRKLYKICLTALLLTYLQSFINAETISLANGDFEQSADQLVSWRFFNVGTGKASAVVSSDAYSGRGAAQLSVTSADGMVDAGLDNWDNRMEVQGDKVLCISFAAKKVAGENAHIVCDVTQFGKDGVQSASSSFNINSASDSYTVFTRRIRTSADSTSLCVGFRIKGDDSELTDGSFLIDDVKVDEEPAHMSVKSIRHGWSAGEEWTVSSKDALSVSAYDETYAFNHRTRLTSSWSVGMDIRINDLDKGIGTARIIFADAGMNPMLKINLERHITGISQVTADMPGRQLLNSRALPGGDSSFYIRLTRVDKDIWISLYGSNGLVYKEQIPYIEPSSLDSVSIIGLGSASSGIDFTNITITSPFKKPSHYMALAGSAIDDLVKNYWVGGLDDGAIIPTYNGYQGAEKSPMPKGALWERGMMILAMDTWYRVSGDPLIKRRLAAEWNRMKRIYSKQELETAGNIVHPACDDSGWDSMMYMNFYRILGDKVALESAKGLIDSAFNRWFDDDFGGGMKYDNRKMKSLYQVGVLNCAIQLWQETGDRSYYDKALGCYNWIESHLLRPDGLYWCDYGINGPELKDRPNDIFEGGSISFFGGNMGMGVLHARLYRITGDETYLKRARRTADAIYNRERRGGIYLNDRDAWSNGTFAGLWAQEVLTLPGMDTKHRKILQKTADSIYKKARTTDGFYGGSWGGPAIGPSSPWIAGGFRPQQIMTSASSANMIMGAALLEKTQSK